MEYRLIEFAHKEMFVQVINESLFDKWELHGPTFINDNWYSQAMTRKTDEESQQQEIFEK